MSWHTFHRCCFLYLPHKSVQFVVAGKKKSAEMLIWKCVRVNSDENRCVIGSTSTKDIHSMTHDWLSHSDCLTIKKVNWSRFLSSLLVDLFGKSFLIAICRGIFHLYSLDWKIFISNRRLQEERWETFLLTKRWFCSFVDCTTIAFENKVSLNSYRYPQTEWR